MLDAALTTVSDRIDHDGLLEALEGFPARELVRAWLKARVFKPDQGFPPT
ncbi:hypothetical protein [Actinomadura sp. WAC 06369]|nr:hypothetical protein [Actinomadura sp. WAC 06369]